MKRIFVFLAATLVMAAMMVVVAAPAFAQGRAVERGPLIERAVNTQDRQVALRAAVARPIDRQVLTPRLHVIRGLSE